MKLHALMTTVGCVLAMTGCPDDGGGKPDSDTTSGADGDATTPSDGETTTATDTQTPTDTTPPIDVHVDEWPWPTEVVNVPASAHWRATAAFPEDPFLAAQTVFDPPPPRWLKFVVLTGDPTKVYFQDSVEYPFHYDFAEAELPPFEGLTSDQFDAVTLPNTPGKKAILGAVLYAPTKLFNGADQRREIGVQLVGSDPYPEVVTETVLSLVRDHVTVSDGKAEPQVFYFPTFEQLDQAAADAAKLSAAGFEVSSVERWATGDSCYATGWALGKLVKVPAGQISDAYAAGTLKPEDILYTDGVPAEVPFVAGIVSSAASTPSSHVAILSQTFGVPFVYVATQQSKMRAEALTNHMVALRTGVSFGASATGACKVSMVDLEGLLSEEDHDAILALKAPEPLVFPAKASLGSLTRAAESLTTADIKYFGGKASHFGILAREIPDASPSPAIGLSMDLWDAIVGPAKSAIAEKLSGYHWPPDIGAMKASLAEVRDMVKALDVPAETQTQVRELLADAGFDQNQNIRFRSSTNVEDQESFTGAGLYDSYSGCLADDEDADSEGPSLCDSTEENERGVFRAIKKVYASFWNDNAYLERLRHAVDETKVGMGLLVHPSFPDAIEMANGVATAGITETTAVIDLVTQLGAVSVTNPEGNAIPEVMTASIYSFGTYFDLRQSSSLVPLGGTVLTYEDDYKELAALIAKIGDKWPDASGAFSLDLEYKKVRGSGATPDHMEIKQVRPLPRPDADHLTTGFLLPEEPVELCTFQGEYGGLYGTWRLKSRVTLDHKVGFLDEEAQSKTLYDTVRIERSGGIDFDGNPTQFPGASHEPPDVPQNVYAATDTWQTGSGATLQKWQLATTFSWQVGDTQSPLQIQSDGGVQLAIEYATPQPEPDTFEGETLYDGIALVPCPETVFVTPAHAHNERVVEVGDVTVDIKFYWPPAPTGITAGYTAPLAKWDVTTITGLTETNNGAPIELRGYWSQTYHPGHHNFNETFMFEPRVEEGMDPAVIAELNAKDIAAIVVNYNTQTPTIQLIGLDGTLRDL